jgi:hypothetical protein
LFEPNLCCFVACFHTLQQASMELEGSLNQHGLSELEYCFTTTSYINFKHMVLGRGSSILEELRRWCSPVFAIHSKPKSCYNSSSSMCGSPVWTCSDARPGKRNFHAANVVCLLVCRDAWLRRCKCSDCYTHVYEDAS